MTPRRDASGWTRAEREAADVLIWLRAGHGAWFSYADIAVGTGLPDNWRIRKAVGVVRGIADGRGDRLEVFRRGRDTARPKVFVSRYMRAGLADELSGDDALVAARKAMSFVKDMHRAARYESKNPRSDKPKGFKRMAVVTDRFVSDVTAIADIGAQVVRLEDYSLLDRKILDLEARLAEAEASAS